LQLKGAKVVTGARQTGVKDRNFKASTKRFWREKPHFDRGFLHKPGQSFQILREGAKMMVPPFLLRQQASPNVNAV
jgi:hypothetical protein